MKRQEAEAPPAIDLTGVALSDVVRLYLDRVDKKGSYVLCPELVDDRRLVSLRTSQGLTRASLDGLLTSQGYSMEDKDGVLYICPVNQPETSAEPSQPSSDTPVASGPPEASGEAPAGPAVARPPAVIAKLAADPEADFIESLVTSGSRFIGCTVAPRGRVMVFDAGSGAGSVTVRRADFLKTQYADLYSCH